MTKSTVLCVGCGYTATGFADQLRPDGWEIHGTTRSPEKADALVAKKINPIIWNDEKGFAVPGSLNAILISTPPGAGGCPALPIIQAALSAATDKPNWIGYLSSNGVYGNHDGEWVDETTQPMPSSVRGQRRLHAENSWLDFGAQSDIPIVVFRLPGIYGPGRSALDSVRQGRAKRIFKDGQVFSRAHVADIVSALVASLANPDAGQLFNIADDEPAPPQDVITYACTLLGVSPPPLVPIEDAALSEMGKSFYQDNKRVRNDQLKRKLNISLAYPTYRDGLDAIFAGEKTRT